MDGFSAQCEVESNCGYSCTGSIGNPDICVSSCGDGYKAADEVCDDYNTDNDNGCSSTCDAIEAGWVCVVSDCATMTCDEVCDNNVKTKNESYDDSNTGSLDGC